MNLQDIPNVKPANPKFSSGPCRKYSSWCPAIYDGELLGRSHRSTAAKSRIKSAIELTTELLKLPEGYKIAIIGGSDTAAMEAAMWNLLGRRAIEILIYEY